MYVQRKGECFINIRFAKVKDGAKIPCKRREDAGLDIYPCFDEEFIIVDPFETKMIPTGIASAFQEKYFIKLCERGSTGTKGIAQRSGVIDSGYRGEWLVPVTNINEKPLIIYKDSFSPDPSIYIMYPYTKAICQAVVLPVPEVGITEIEYEELKNIASERGSGKLGSSGK